MDDASNLYFRNDEISCTIIYSVDFFKGSMILTYLFFNIASNNIPWTMQAVFFTLVMVIFLCHPWFWRFVLQMILDFVVLFSASCVIISHGRCKLSSHLKRFSSATMIFPQAKNRQVNFLVPYFILNISSSEDPWSWCTFSFLSSVVKIFSASCIIISHGRCKLSSLLKRFSSATMILSIGEKSPGEFSCAKLHSECFFFRWSLKWCSLSLTS